MTRTTRTIATIMALITSISMFSFLRIDLSYIQLSAETQLSAATTFEQQLATFPESYQASLIALHNLHPSWIFEAVPITDSWPVVIQKELEKEDLNLIPNSSNRAWIRSFKVYDGTTWVPASSLLLSYYMDPRNFLTEKAIFQFEKLSYDAATQNEAGVRAIFKDNAGLLSMVSYVLTAAQSSNSSAYFLASRIRQEVSESSSYGIVNSARGDLSASYPPLTSGGISPCFMTPAEQLEALLALPSRNQQQETWLAGLQSNPQIAIPLPTARYYNVYNIGAVPNPSVIDGARINAIKYAMNSNASFDLPWTSMEKAVTGGAKYIASNYIAKGQDTMYFQKFAVSGDPSILYVHQYMQNVQAANSEGQRYNTAYANAGMLDQPFVFRIPVYRDMPQKPCGLPNVMASSKQSTALPGLPGLPVMSDSVTYNIRASASATATILGKTSKSTSYMIEDVVVGESTTYGNLWYQISYQGQMGFIVVDLNGQILPVKVSYDSKGGTSIPVSYVNRMSLITKPQDPTRSGYVFLGWFKDSAYTTLWDFSKDSVSQDMTLYAKWIDQKTYEKIDLFVTRFYELCLSRTPDPTGLRSWSVALANGNKTGADVAYGFVFSSEFLGKGLDDASFTGILYHAFFARDPDPSGQQAWADALSSGMSRFYVLRGFTNSQEFVQLCQSYLISPGSLTLSSPADLHPEITAFVTRFYKECLGRMPDSVGINDWVSQLSGGSRSGSDVAYGFIFSPEFVKKGTGNEEFVRIMYRAFFDREPDEAGKQNWISLLNAGQSRESVLYGFVYSQEFAGLCDRYQIRAT